MSTVALKGKLEFGEDKKWHWKGKWAFGSHIQEFPTKASPKQQPFHYTFEEAVDPATVAVPSLNIPPPSSVGGGSTAGSAAGDDDVDDDDDEEEQQQGEYDDERGLNATEDSNTAGTTNNNTDAQSDNLENSSVKQQGGEHGGEPEGDSKPVNLDQAKKSPQPETISKGSEETNDKDEPAAAPTTTITNSNPTESSSSSSAIQ
eukprot:scaffold1784_cov116-Cylindrotheca_fusiformis.AAC.22